ncbi:hypothetical protein [Serratia sp. (in: enterobacteria)]|uniref:hypothetical protein n=1 Tax=Serratia sp. (in: enterobacteria) TaxID=616 RepID=UPI00398915AA
MKNILIITLLAMPSIGYASSRALDYCAAVESWAAQKTIDSFVNKNQELDPQRATSSLLVRTALKDKRVPVMLGDWGQLYTQTIKITIPFVGNKKPPMTVIASAIISAEECSLSEPSFIEISNQ